MAKAIQVHPVDSEGSSSSWPDCNELSQMVESRPEFKYPGGLQKLAERLGTDLEKGLPQNVDEKARIKHFGKNAFADKELNSYWYYIKQALHDKLIIGLICMATIEMILCFVDKEKLENEGWIDPLVIYSTVLLIINVQSLLD